MSSNRVIADETTGRCPFPPLPIELELLFVGPEEPSWTTMTLQLDRRGCTQPAFRWCSTLVEATRHLRHEGFDCVIIDDVTASDLSSNDSILTILQAIRTAGCDDPLLLLTDRVDDAFLTSAAVCDCELLVTRTGWRSTAVVEWIRRAIERWKISRERELHRLAEENQTSRLRDESVAVLARRRDLAGTLSKRGGTGTSNAWTPPAMIQACYEDLLRTTIACGSPGLPEELERLLHQMVRSDITPTRALLLHLAAVESLLTGLHGSTARHVIERADLLALELLARLGDRQITQASPFETGLDLLDQSSTVA